MCLLGVVIEFGMGVSRRRSCSCHVPSLGLRRCPETQTMLMAPAKIGVALRRRGGGEVTTLEDYLGESSAASARPGRRRPVHHDERDKRGLGVACARSLTA